jgi:uncharacterized membrane protein (DUF4010 family)
MSSQFPIFISSEAFKVFMVLFLSFLIGLEREEHKINKGYAFGGVRTYPLIGLMGYSMAFISQNQILPIAIGLAVISGFMMISYWYKIQSLQRVGFTSEIAGLTTYLIGALVYNEYLWVASTLAIASLILLELKSFLEGLASCFSEEDILTFTKFLFLTIVVLPILPNETFSTWEINPFKTWLVVVAVSTISYSSFLLQRVIKGKGGITLVALLGGAYSSTVTTVALAKQSHVDPENSSSYIAAIVMASGIMYLRLILLLQIFNSNLAHQLIIPFIFLATTGVVGGFVILLRGNRLLKPDEVKPSYPKGNPLELTAAFSFALLFVAITITTHYTIIYLGKSGVYTLAGIMGITDVDPFILGLTQSAGQSVSIPVAAISILIATASNNIVKGIYALIFGDSQTGKKSFYWLLLFSFLGLIPLWWLK